MKKKYDFKIHEKTEAFARGLKKNRMPYEVKSPFHVQVATYHNFYPTTRRYHNSETGKKIKPYPLFKGGEEFMQFIRDNNN